MGLFEKKYCDVCGAKIGLLGNRKLEDGNLCKECAAKLSPWFSERRQSTVDEIKEQLAYREANLEKVAAFNVTRTLGGQTKVMLDEDRCQLIITSDSNWKDENPDVLDFTQITGCDTEVQENRTELMHQDEDGLSRSYDPPRYDVDYDFRVTIHVNSPWFADMGFNINDVPIKQRGDVEYNDCQRQAEEMKTLIEELRQGARDKVVAQNAPQQKVICPNCGATTTPDANGCCEFCGGALPSTTP